MWNCPNTTISNFLCVFLSLWSKIHSRGIAKSQTLILCFWLLLRIWMHLRKKAPTKEWLRNTPWALAADENSFSRGFFLSKSKCITFPGWHEVKVHLMGFLKCMGYGDGQVYNTNLENSKKFKLFCPSQWGGGKGRNTIQNVPSHLSQSFPKPSKQCILMLLFVFL